MREYPYARCEVRLIRQDEPACARRSRYDDYRILIVIKFTSTDIPKVGLGAAAEFAYVMHHLLFI
jgi:hypothetical protein